ncbi:hypothetical protein HY212_01050 [Candidatus Pacearchaeota archaeon]|nr:hypothetical protein [Candidatus Pacearchaeota archaeon]
MSEIFKYASLNAIGTAAYIALIGIFLNVMNGSRLENSHTILGPISAIMLLVFSAALVGSLIFGRPVVWYINGKKKEAITLLFTTLVIFLVITILVILNLILWFI